MTRLDPSIGFYLRHADDVEALEELEAAPPDVDTDDWARFLDVNARARQHIATLITAARDEGARVIQPHAVVSSAARDPMILRDHAAWAELKPRKRTRFEKKLYVGASIGGPPGPDRYLLSYVACSGGLSATRTLKGMLVAGGAAPETPDDSFEWFFTDAVILDMAKMVADGEIESLLASSKMAFERLKENWVASLNHRS